MPVILMGLDNLFTLLSHLEATHAYLCDFDRLFDFGGLLVALLDLFAQ
jgi:hypothetical protein